MLSEALTVTELTQGIKQLLELNYGELSLKGEISNLARPSSGHVYFNVKDDRSQISGVMFRSAAQRCRFELENGLEVLLFGRITVYEPRGVYQIIVDRVEPLGAGALQFAFEQLKEKLSKEGLFDPQFKCGIPYLPEGIGIVTSPTGAAVRDILNVLGRRFPNVPVLIYPVSVQGDRAAGEIALAIDQFQNIPGIDLLIVGRGGGSIEDLWAFNEEIVARAIFRSKIPIISAVGHETDFTISDFVADMRAPTPSAAAELAVPLKDDLVQRIDENRRKLTLLMDKTFRHQTERLEFLRKRLRSPEWVIQAHMLKTDELTGRLVQTISNRLMLARGSWEKLDQKLTFQSPLSGVESMKKNVQDLKQQLGRIMKTILEQKKNGLLEMMHVLESVNPLSILNRGYAAVTDLEKNVVTSIHQMTEDATFLVHMTDGTIQSKAQKIIPKQSTNKKT
ncbi:MAG: exodeoxyribonuclease VII large subunit [Proteobacteria bacterium]|nr:exodeoxyribonuclease VII large subunit [Pseudomonadota bacterium]